MARAALVVICLLAAGIIGIIVLIRYDMTRSTSILPVPRAMRVEPAPRWSVTGRVAAHKVLVAHVETEFLDEALPITQEIAEPLKEKFAEILVYFHRPGRPDTLPPRRVQWSRAQGYVETVY